LNAWQLMRIWGASSAPTGRGARVSPLIGRSSCAYEALREELAEARAAATTKHAPERRPVRWPNHLDPFDVFAGYPTATVSAKNRVQLTPDAETDAFEARLSLKIAALEIMRVPPLPVLKQLPERLRAGPQDLETFLRPYGAADRTRALRGLMLMAKFGLVAIEPLRGADEQQPSVNN